MTKLIRIKMLLAILAVLVAIGALLRKSGDPIPVTSADRQVQQKLSQKVQPSSKRYLVP